MGKDPEKDVAEFRPEAVSGQDPDAKAFAAETQPTLKEHLHGPGRAVSKSWTPSRAV
jgi:hypothetical protein